MVPRFTEFYIPVLQVMSNVEPIEINALIDKVADHVNLSEEDRNVLTESGGQYRYRSNISWAVTDLCQGNFIERVKRGYYVITISGLELLEESFDKIDREVLAARSESFRAFMEKKGTRKGKTSQENASSIRRGENFDIESDPEDTEKITNEETGEVSLNELYSIRETLRKAKIPTVDIDVKIKELETESFFNSLIPSLARILPKALSNIKGKVSFTVEYNPDTEMNITFGDTKRTRKFLITGEDSLRDEIITKQNLIKKRSESTDIKIKKPEAPLSGKWSSVQEKPAEMQTKINRCRGVWIEQYKDRMIVVKGDTEPFNDLFASYGGRFINNPTEGWKGWIFMNNREQGLRSDLDGFIIADPLGKSATSNRQDNHVYPNESNDTLADGLITRYIESFSSLKRFNFLGITGPHKAIMLVAIFKGIRKGLFLDNKIKFSSDLETLEII